MCRATHESNTPGKRCGLCGHRVTVNGVPPRQTRDIAKTRPWFVLVELHGRHRAKRLRGVAAR